MNDAAGVASGVRREFDTVFRNQADRILRDLDVVKREEFEAVKEMARLAREENEALKARIAALEAKVAAAPASRATPRRRPAGPDCVAGRRSTPARRRDRRAPHSSRFLYSPACVAISAPSRDPDTPGGMSRSMNAAIAANSFRIKRISPWRPSSK